MHESGHGIAQHISGHGTAQQGTALHSLAQHICIRPKVCAKKQTATTAALLHKVSQVHANDSNEQRQDSLVAPLRLLPQPEVLLPEGEGVDWTPSTPHSW